MSDFQAFHGVTHPIVRLVDDWNQLLDHGLEKTVDYIIRVNGALYEAIDGHTGKLFTSNPDARILINACINTLIPGNGIILCKGDIYLSDSINLITPNGISLIFDTFYITTNSNGIIVGTSGASTEHTGKIIGNRIFVPDAYTGAAIQLLNVWNSEVSVRQIITTSGVATGVGLQIIGNKAGCWGNKASIGVIDGFNIAIHIQGYGAGGFSNANIIRDCIILPDGLLYGVLINIAAGGINASGNTIKTVLIQGLPSGSYGFANYDENNIFIACRCVDSVAGAHDWYTNAQVGNKRPILFACQKSTGDISGDFILYNTNGYITENSGTSHITSGNTSVVVNHGCDYTPTADHVTVFAKHATTNDFGYFYIDTFTSTQMTVHCAADPGASDLYFSWHVRLNP